MKKSVLIMIMGLQLIIVASVYAQDQPAEYLGLPGDNLNLYAVMDLFQGSRTLENFEKNLNNQDNKINNLDLNGDNMVDYLTVSDHIDGSFHTIVLRDALGPNENQDVAVFSILRLPDGTIQIQLTGDEALYGRNYIIEPINANTGETVTPGYNEQGENGSGSYVSTNQIAYWPLLSFMYSPDYIVWNSLWYWGHYPYYWHPWNTSYWDYYYGYHHNMYPEYYRHYHHSSMPRYEHYHASYYNGYRAHSPQVERRITEGRYKHTYTHPEMRHQGEEYYSRSHAEGSPYGSSGPQHLAPDHSMENHAKNGHQFDNHGDNFHGNNYPDANDHSGNSFSPLHNNPVHDNHMNNGANSGFSNQPPAYHKDINKNKVTPDYKDNHPYNHTTTDFNKNSQPKPPNFNNIERDKVKSGPNNHGFSSPPAEANGNFQHKPSNFNDPERKDRGPGNGNTNHSFSRPPSENHSFSQPPVRNPADFHHPTPYSNDRGGKSPENHSDNHGSSQMNHADQSSFHHTNPTFPDNNKNKVNPGFKPPDHTPGFTPPGNQSTIHHSVTNPNNTTNRVTPENKALNHSPGPPVHENSGTFNHTPPAPINNNALREAPHNTPPPAAKPVPPFSNRSTSSSQGNHSPENFKQMQKPSENLHQVHNQHQPEKRNTTDNKHYNNK